MDRIGWLVEGLFWIVDVQFGTSRIESIPGNPFCEPALICIGVIRVEQKGHLIARALALSRGRRHVKSKSSFFSLSAHLNWK